MSWSACVNSPAESGLKMTAPTPAVFSEHSVCSVTAAVVSAKRRSPAGPRSFLRPKRTSPRPKLRLRRGLVAGGDLLRVAARADLGLELRELRVDLRGRRDLRELAVELRVARGEVLERAGCGELVDRGGARLQLLGLVLRALDRHAGVGHAGPDPRRRLTNAHLRLGGGVLRLDHFLLRAERLDLRLELLLCRDELLLLVGELLDLRVETLELLLHGRLLLERLAREVLAVGAYRLAGLRLELHDVLLERLRLQLEALLRSDDVGHTALDVLKLLEHLLVRVVERFRRILRPSQQLRGLRLDVGHRPRQQAGHSSSSWGRELA